MPDELPDWVVSDIESAEFTDTRRVDGTGVILELYSKDNKADVQLYEPVEDGRHIITMDVPVGAIRRPWRRARCTALYLSSTRPRLAKRQSSTC